MFSKGSSLIPKSTGLATALALSMWLSAGCSAPPPSKPDRLVVSVPHLERMDVSSCHGDPTEINLLLSQRAESFAKTVDHGSVWYGEGLSMEPVLEPGSWIVTHPHPFEELKPGMVVLYTTTEGRPVAHALVRRTSRGWLVVGVNNRRVDPELVTATNIAGVIAAVFIPLN
jgi:hypothetical protein